MVTNPRRSFLKGMGAAALAAALPESITRALAIPANNRTGTIQDIEHIVILMQENRSFDHYFGTLKGVRGFGDPRPVTLPTGKPVWYQPNGNSYVLPFHPNAPHLGLQFIEDLPHSWNDTHAAWNHGNYDHFVPSKGTTTMAYLKRQDIPYHYALADAFTVCDAYHCSFMGSTDPNRYYMWTGWTGNDGGGGGPVLNNAEAGYDWYTYPERLETAGISWKIYQDIGVGLDAAGFWGWTGDQPYIGNYGDNSLLYFHQYQNALPGSALYQKARTGTNVANGGTLFDVLRADVKNNTLPQVSWIVAPESYTEHPNWPANYGAWYVSQVLNALTSNKDLWSKTAFFLTYDENDGFFDHAIPATAPESATSGKSTVDTSFEILPGNGSFVSGPYGLGQRVPMIVISPWSKGGWVCSQTFDHTSLIQFIEQRFGVMEPQIPAWRRAVCGDLTAAFDFATPNAVLPNLPKTNAYAPKDYLIHPDYHPVPPAHQTLPKQEPGLRFARALPYEIDAQGHADSGGGTVRIDFTNTGKQAACFHVRSLNSATGPWAYTVEGGKSLSDSWNVTANFQRKYDLTVHGPNGFFREFAGSASGSRTNLDIASSYDANQGAIVTRVTNVGSTPCRVNVMNAYSNEALSHQLTPGQSFTTRWPLDSSLNWYDIVIGVDGDMDFKRRLAGHVENGRPSASDPALG
ncbi:MAG TPA: phospholipase C, phosphocholine-specific [Micropepsaceae bacterium]|nr:phospholipase C, phosphocholine-specific [Micropepsaceae bacterium]